jgi:transcriptional regulator with XRE-family HTH domain
MASLGVGNLGEFLREQRRQARLSLRQLAEAAGVSNPYLSQIERGLRKPSAEILQQIAKGLRISAETLYVQAGILDDERAAAPAAGAAGGVREAVRADPYLTEEQRQALLQIYESFTRDARDAAGAAGARDDARRQRPSGPDRPGRDDGKE